MERVVRVLPDIAALNKTFDYLVPDSFGDQGGFGDITVGTMVRVALHGRRVGGWVVADGVDPPAGVKLLPLAKVTGMGPSAEIIDLANWAAWRWAGRASHFLRTASPQRVVRTLPNTEAPAIKVPAIEEAIVDDLGLELLANAPSLSPSVIRLAPAQDRLGLVATVARHGTTLVITPSRSEAATLSKQLRARGISTALMPQDWALAAAGAQVVLGSRAAVWAPTVNLSAVVVLDEHDEALQEEAAPTWHAREVAIERARRSAVPCILVSPCPSLEALSAGPLTVLSRAHERSGWPVVDVIDRRREEPLKVDLYSPRLIELIRAVLAREPDKTSSDVGAHQVVCVLNRKGRARLLACAACAELARCTQCGAAVGSSDDATLSCPRCNSSRPLICTNCGAGRIKVLRVGVARAREDLERLLGVEVAEVTGELKADEPLPQAPVLVGTEAVLHRVRETNLVAFLDLDASLLAPRYRASEETMALLARSARLLGGRARNSRLVLQTRVPNHEVVQAALHADPSKVAVVEGATRAALRLPPEVAMAEISGATAESFIESLRSQENIGQEGIEIIGPVRDRYLVRANDHQILCDALMRTPRPSGRLRVAVDPTRL